MPDAEPPPIARRRRFRLSVRGLIVLVGLAGLVMGLGMYRLANRNPERSWVTRQIRAFADPEPENRLAAIEGLASADAAELPRAVPPLVASVTSDPDPSVRAAAAALLGKIAHRTNPGPPIVFLTGSPVPPSSRSPLFGTISSALIEAMGDEGGAVRIAAFRAYQAIAPAVDPAPDRLIVAINDEDEAVRDAAIQAVRREWSNPVPIASALRDRIASAEGIDRTDLIVVLSLHDPEAAARFVPILVGDIEGMAETPSWYRVPVVEALGRIGPPAGPALPAIRAFVEESFDDPHPGSSWATAAEAIAAIDPTSEQARWMIRTLIGELSTATDNRGYWTLVALSRFGPYARQALPLVEAIADDPDRGAMMQYEALRVGSVLASVDESKPVASDPPSGDPFAGEN